MVRLAGFLAGCVLALAAPAMAQDPAPPRYSSNSGISEEGSVFGRGGSIVRADPKKSPARRAREEASATVAETACTAGDRAGCAALGQAYMLGAGRPQNRPVAELLFSESCDAGEAMACLGLGQLLWSESLEDAPMFFDRGCRLGSLEACEGLARAMAEDDAEAAAALRRETCAKGGTAACRSLAQQQLQSETSPAEQAEAQREFQRLCQGGDRQSCVILADQLGGEQRYADDLPTPAVREILALGCRAGEGVHCRNLAMAVFAEGSGPPERRAEALALFDQACDSMSEFCEIPAHIRARPALDESCARGRADDCLALGRIYATSRSPLDSPADAVKALGAACDGGAIDACGMAAAIILDDTAPDAAASAQRWYMIGCNGGNDGDCASLSRRLFDGDRFPRDPARAYALLALACERGNGNICDDLEERGKSDPEAPLPVADGRYLPDDPELEDEWRRQKNKERMVERAAYLASICTSTAVMFRGVLYEDSLCDPASRVIRGFLARPNQAPWQALLWRPEQYKGDVLKPGDRVECGGALVRENWVLTAAHCIVDKNGKSTLEPGHRIRLGVLNAQANEGISYPILRAIAHPNYHEKTRSYDIALVQYDTRQPIRGATTNRIARIQIDPLPIEQRTIRSGMPVYTFGWGRTSNGGITSAILKGAKLQLEDPTACANRTNFNRGSLKDALLCASAPDRSQACNGDSGGPLITYGDRVPTVIGVVSAGTECGTTGVPTRYTRVAKVRAWIATTLASTPRVTAERR